MELKLHGNTNKLSLSNPHKPFRWRSETERLNKMKADLTSSKQDLKTSVRKKQIILYGVAWISLFFVSLDNRFNKLRNLLKIFCTEKVHTVQEYSNTGETNTEDIIWRGHEVILQYKNKIACSPINWKMNLKFHD